MSEATWLTQPHRVRLEWGRRGARRAASRGDVVIVVDVLRFSTVAVAAAAGGVRIYPACDDQEAKSLAAKRDAIILERGLAPASYDALSSGTRVALPSPNGATCVALARTTSLVMIAALTNASAAARCASWLMQNTRVSLSVIACGERWPESKDNLDEDGRLRFAIEDYLGAGAVLWSCDGDLSPEATLAARAFDASRSHLAGLLLGCASGIELVGRGDRASVEAASQLDLHQVVPILRGEALVPFHPRDAHDLAQLLG